MPAHFERVRDGGGGPRSSKLYGRRKGPKLSAHQAALVESLLPQLKLIARKNLDPRLYFESQVDDVWLEIGFGAGEHLVWQVQHHPGVGMLAAEPYQAGVAKLLSKLNALSPPAGAAGDLPARIRIHSGDARDVINDLPAASLGRVFLLFPDPWPKRRHHKRRFVQMATLDALARVMKPGAELRFASDDAAHVAWALEHMLAHRQFAWIAERPAHWLMRPEDWPATRYEQKALHGIPTFLRFMRGTDEARAGLAIPSCRE